MILHKTYTQTFSVTETYTREKTVGRTVTVVINDEIFISLVTGCCPIIFHGSQGLHKFDKIFLFPS